MSTEPVPESIPEPDEAPFAAFGRLIRAERERLDLGQTDLANDMVIGTAEGVSDSQLRRWENGKVSFPEQRLEPLIKAFAAFAKRRRLEWNSEHANAMREAWAAGKAKHEAVKRAKKKGRGRLWIHRGGRMEGDGQEHLPYLPPLDEPLTNENDATLRAIMSRPVNDVASYVLRRAALLRRSTLEGSSTAGGMHRSFVNLQLRPRLGAGPGAQPKIFRTLSDLLANNPDAPIILLLGDPGGGKSTLLRDLELRVAYSWLIATRTARLVPADGVRAALPAGPGTSGQLPELCIRVSLADYKAATDDHPDPANWLEGALQRQCQRTGDKAPDLASLARFARVRWLLDGLNEVPADNPDLRFAAQGQVIRWAAAQGGAGGQTALITVRNAEYQRVGTGVDGHERPDEVDVLPWTDEQVYAYIDRYFEVPTATANFDGDSGFLSPMRQAISGLPDAQRRDLLALLRNPFNLKLQCDLYQADGGLLALNRGDLLGRIALLRLEDALRTPGKLPAASSRLLLAHDRKAVEALAGPPVRPLHAWKSSKGGFVEMLSQLAYALHLRDGSAWSRFAPDDLPQPPAPSGSWVGLEPALAIARALLLVEGAAAEGTQRFMHQLWQEYLAAIALVRGSELDWPDFSPPSRQPQLDWELPPPVPSEWDQCAQLAVQIAEDPLPLLNHIADANLALAGRAAALRWPIGSAGAATGNLSKALSPIVQEQMDDLRLRLMKRMSDSRSPVASRIEAGELLGALSDTIRYQQHIGTDGLSCLLPRERWAENGRGWIPIPNGPQVFRVHDQEVRVVIGSGLLMAYAPVTVSEFRCFVEAAKGYGGLDDSEPPPWWRGEAAQRWWRGELVNEAQRNGWREARDAWQAATQEMSPALRQTKCDLVRQTWFPAYSDAVFDTVRVQRLDADRDGFEVWLNEACKPSRKRAPELWNSQRYSHGTQPVIGVSLFEAEAYCAWLTMRMSGSGRCFRLPTEAEWAILAQDGREYDGSRSPDKAEPLPTERMNFVDGLVRRPSPVGAYPAGRLCNGAQDLAGNVWEWCSSAVDSKDLSKVSGIDRPADSENSEVARAVRGGSWLGTEEDCAPTFRDCNQPADRGSALGFRLLNCPLDTDL